MFGMETVTENDSFCYNAVNSLYGNTVKIPLWTL